MRRLSLLVLALFVSTANAEVSIIGPDKGLPGDLIELEVEAEGATTFDWKVIPATTLEGKPTYVVYCDKSKMVLCSRPGTYFIVCTAAKLVEEQIELESDLATVVIDGPTPPGPPEPPEPDPNPPGPALEGLAKLSHDLSQGLPDSERSAVASSYSSMASKLAGLQSNYEGIEGFDALLQETTALNREAIPGGQVNAWRDKFFVPLGKEIEKLYYAGDLASVDSRMEAWRDIAKGLSE